jgi:hypothetical protein
VFFPADSTRDELTIGYFHLATLLADAPGS